MRHLLLAICMVISIANCSDALVYNIVVDGADANQIAWPCSASGWSATVVQGKKLFPTPNLMGVDAWGTSSNGRSMNFQCYGFSGKTYQPFADEYWCANEDYSCQRMHYATVIANAANMSGSVGCSGNGSTWPKGSQYYVAVCPDSNQMYQEFMMQGSPGWRQIDAPYAGTDYGEPGVSNLKIRDQGCFFMSCCNALNMMGIKVEPLAMNTWMRAHHGYVGSSGLQVSMPKIKKYVSDTFHVDIAIIQKGNSYDFKELLLRGSIGTIVSVKPNGGHWALALSFYGINGNDAYISDPAGAHNNMKGYPHPEPGNVRGMYITSIPKKFVLPSSSLTSKVSAVNKSAALQQVNVADLSIDTGIPYEGSTDATWLQSDIAAWSTSNVNISLRRDGSTVTTGTVDRSENATTGVINDDGKSLGVSHAPSGHYTLAITGAPGAIYRGCIEHSSTEVDKDIPFSGTLPATGAATVEFDHIADVMFANLGSIDSMAEGTYIFAKDGQITSVVPGGFYVQPIGGYVPATFCHYSGQVESLREVTNLQGTVKIGASGKRYIEVVDLYYAYNWYYYPDSPLADIKPSRIPTVPVARVSGTMHTLVNAIGKYTGRWDGGIYLDGIKVAIEKGVENIDYILSEADLWCPGWDYTTFSLPGVWHEGVFYVKDTFHMTWGCREIRENEDWPDLYCPWPQLGYNYYYL